MMPADIVATAAAKLLRLDGEKAAHFRFAVVAYLTFPIIAAVTLVYVFRLLKELGFSSDHAVLGCVGLLVGSTFLKYMQEREEQPDVPPCGDGCRVPADMAENRIDGISFSGDDVSGLQFIGSHYDGLDAFFLSLLFSRPWRIVAAKTGRQRSARGSALRFICRWRWFMG